MNEPLLGRHLRKLPWLKRLAIWCGALVLLVLVVMFALNLILKRVIAEKIEDVLARNSWKAEIGEFDYSITRNEFEVRDFSGTPTKQKEMEQIGHVKLDRVLVKFADLREREVGEIHLKGAKAKFGSLDKLDVVMDKQHESYRLCGLKINNRSGFGDDPMIELNEIILEKVVQSINGKKHVKAKLRVDLQRVIIVKNKEGRLNISMPEGDNPYGFLSAYPEFDSEGEEWEIEEFSFVTQDILFQDFSRGEAPKREVIRNEKREYVWKEPDPRDLFRYVTGAILGNYLEYKVKSDF
jgi:hypothetical protein